MKAQRLLRRLRRKGASVELAAGRVVVGGWRRLSAGERRLVTRLRRQLAAALETEAAPPDVPPAPRRRVVGQRGERGADGRLTWHPLYEDEVRRPNPSRGGLAAVLEQLGRALGARERPVSEWPTKGGPQGRATFRA